MKIFWGWLFWLLLLMGGAGCVSRPGTPTLPPASPSPIPTTMPPTPATIPPLAFDGQQAMAIVEAQLAFGPRWPGSPGHQAVGDYIVSQLTDLGWAVEEQYFDYRNQQGRNLIAKANQGQGPIIILGAHYDTRRLADQTDDPAGQQSPVPGANDGASGVAVLLELARTLNLTQIPYEIWLAFFDLEDNGNGGLPGWDWIVGSTYMADSLEVTPQAVVVVDMIGDADQQLFYEQFSDPDLRAQLWQIAADLGYGESFIPIVRHAMIDDHRPFLDNGIVAVDIIDFDYPYWHTVEDTADKVSPASLERVGRTLAFWLENGNH